VKIKEEQVVNHLINTRSKVNFKIRALVRNVEFQKGKEPKASGVKLLEGVMEDTVIMSLGMWKK
jgi:hypothetical protein